MKTLRDIRLALGNHKDRLFHDYPIQSMAIFGSFARSDQHELSDLDILVEFSGRIGIRFIDLAEDLENVTGLHVDLVSKKGVRDKYLKAIESDLIYV